MLPSEDHLLCTQGRPKDGPEDKFRLTPVVPRLEQLLGSKVKSQSHIACWQYQGTSESALHHGHANTTIRDQALALPALSRPATWRRAAHDRAACVAQVKKVDDSIGPAVAEAVSAMSNGEVLVLENVRFYKEETKNDPGYAEKLAANADLYVNDAFGTAHRAHASTEGAAR